MEKTAQMNFRCNAELKAQAEKVYGRWGFSLADAINAFMVKSVEVEGFPFELRKDPYAPIKFEANDPMVVVPKRNSDGVMIWDDPDLDEEGDIYDQFATR